MKSHVMSWTAVALGFVAGFYATDARAQNQYSSITIFGDSLSDPGNIPRFLGFSYPPPPYYQYQFSNGPNYSKYLDSVFGISTPVNDFAIGGAESGVGNIGGLPGNPSIGLPNSGMDGEISYYLQSKPTPGKNDLFIIWGGANDYLNLVQGLGPGLTGAPLTSYLTSPTGPVTTTVGNLVTDVKRLAAIGVKNFVVPNLPNLGATPLLNGSATTSGQGAQLTAAHNQTLAAAMGQLQQQLHVNVTIVDIGAIFNDILAHPAKYGVSPYNITDQCILNPTCVAQHQNYVFWDTVHPTAQLQQELSYVFLSSVDGPTTVGPEMDLAKIVQQDLFDHISARAASLRLGAAGLLTGGFGGDGGTVGDPDQPLSAFVTDSYGWGSRDPRQNSVGFNYHQNTTSGGVDYRINDWSAVGALIGYSTADDSLGNTLGAQSVDSYQFALYGTAFADGWYGSAAGTYMYNQWSRLDRNVFVGNEVANAQTSGRILGGKLEGGYVFQTGKLSVGPAAELRYAEYRIGSYTESGAVGLNQEVDGQALSSMIGQIGVQAALATMVGDYVVVPQLRVNFDHAFHNDTRAIVTRIASQLSTSVTTDLYPDTSDWVRIGGGVNVRLADAIWALVDFDTTVGRTGGEDYNALFRLKARF